MPPPALFHDSLGAYVRYRSRSGMRDLTLAQDSEFYFAADECFYDRVIVRLNASIILSDVDELESVLGLIGQNLDPDSVVRITPKHQNQYEMRTLKNRWLFGIDGTMRWHRHARRLSVNAEVRLNPTRFLAHQATVNLDNLADASPEDVLRFNASLHHAIAAQTLDGQSNVLIGLDRIGSSSFEGRATRRQRLMEIYLSKIDQLLRRDFHDPTHNYSLDQMQISTVSVAEIYWELSHPDAVSFVADFSAAITSCDRCARTFIQPLERGGLGNVRWIKLPLTQAISLKVYAKTADRVRCEITFTGSQGRISQIVQRRTGANRTNPLQILDALRTDAAQRVQNAWETVMSLTGFADETADLLDFVERIDRSVPRPSRRTVFSLLINHGGLAQTDDDGMTPASVCRALCREGVLVETSLRQRAGKSFALTPAYARLFQLMSGRSVPIIL